MDDNQIYEFRNQFATIIPNEFMELYHGTNDEKFAIEICQKHGWQSPQAFRAVYCCKQLGGTAIYGPGIYLTSSKKEAKYYGSNILVFSFKAASDFLDLNNSKISKNAVKAVGGGKQTLLKEEKLDMLIRVTKHYFVLRTPLLVSAHME